MSTHQLVSKHVEAALGEATSRGIADDVVDRCLLSEAIRIFKRHRPNDDIAADHQFAHACLGNAIAAQNPSGCGRAALGGFFDEQAVLYR